MISSASPSVSLTEELVRVLRVPQRIDPSSLSPKPTPRSGRLGRRRSPVVQQEGFEPTYPSARMRTYGALALPLGLCWMGAVAPSSVASVNFRTLARPSYPALSTHLRGGVPALAPPTGIEPVSDSLGNCCLSSRLRGHIRSALLAALRSQEVTVVNEQVTPSCLSVSTAARSGHQ